MTFKRPLTTFLATTLATSSIFYALIIHAGHLGAASGLYVYGLMWCPGISALITCKLLGRPIGTLGWSWKPRYQLVSYLLPIAYALVAYGAVWILGFGGFPNRQLLAAFAQNAGITGLSSNMVLVVYVLMVGTIGMVGSSASALGEEIGWRGFLVPELARRMSFTATALVSGLIWAAWHTPILLFADYNAGTAAWYALLCFTVMVVAASFVFAWLRLKSGSLWTAVFLHASHNLWIQSIFTPLTVDTGRTKWAIDEFGFALPIVAVVFALYFWRRRGEVSTQP